MNMNQKARDTVRVTLTLDKAVLAALDIARIDDQLSRSNFARAALVRQLRKAGHLGGKAR